MWSIKVSQYNNGKMCLKLVCKNNHEDVTIFLNDNYANIDHIFLDPKTKDNGLLTALKKARIIKSVVGIAEVNKQIVPIAEVNMGILKDYDYSGVMKYKDKEVFK